MSQSDLPADQGRGNIRQTSDDPLHEAGSAGGESGNGQMKPHTRPERTEPRVATTRRGSVELGAENGRASRPGTQQDRAEEVAERKHDGGS